MLLFKSFGFESAHYLPKVPKGHKCGRMHGHSFRCEIGVEGPIDPDTGWVMDYADIKKAFKGVEALLDHNCLNEIEGLENPTSEVIARWIWIRLKPVLPGLAVVILHETCTARCEYRGD
jgi:6-pyruvoyltetrahydropterin/6-carboxytetrahydropterin synthase